MSTSGRRGQGDAREERTAGATARAGLPRIVFDTLVFAPRERFDAWREVLNNGHRIDADPKGFAGRLSAAALDRMVLTRMDTTSLAVARTVKQIRRDGLERFILNFTTVGFDVEVNGASVRFGADTVAVSDTTQPFQRGYAPERSSIFVSLARELVEEAIPEPERLHARPFSPEANALLVDHLKAMDRWSSTAEALPSAHLGRATAHLLAACLDFSPEALERARPMIEAAQRRRARRHIDQHLASPDLTPETLATALGMSRSKLFALFEPYGGVVSYIQQRRLAAARRRLADPAAALRIADVAYATGFANTSHFSRAFRRTFGQSPSEFQHDPVAASLPQPDGTNAPGWDFSRWMHQLG